MDSAKAQKDLDQAGALFARLASQDPDALQDALDGGCSRGARGWTEPINRSLKSIGAGTWIR